MAEGLILITGVVAVSVLFLASNRLSQKGRPRRVRWSRFPGQFSVLAKVDSGFDYAANFSSFACVA
jgi:hypothetical protein